VPRPRGKRARSLGRLSGGPPLLERDVEPAGPPLQAPLAWQGGRRPHGGAAPTALPHRRAGLGPDEGRALLETDRRNARQQREGARGRGDAPGERGVGAASSAVVVNIARLARAPCGIVVIGEAPLTGMMRWVVPT
jgi:hypothetical protein